MTNIKYMTIKSQKNAMIFSNNNNVLISVNLELFSFWNALRLCKYYTSFKYNYVIKLEGG